MTIAERNNKLKHFITCLKCEASGKCCDDNCSTQYDAGNMGEIIENLEVISKAIEQEPQSFKWCTDCREYDQERHCCHRWSKVIRDTVEEMRQEQEPKPMVEIDLYSVIKQKYIEREVLDKIREQIKSHLRGVEIALEVLVENDPLRPKMEGAKDTLEECLELIDKAETEAESEKMSKHWIDDADHWICPDCGFITSNPNRYAGCKCPKCGFQDEKDKAETEAEDGNVD